MAESFANRRRRRRREEEEEWDEEEEYKKSFFKSAEHFRYGKAGKLNMLTFRKKLKKLNYGYENSF